MLGESHALLVDFPEYTDTILALTTKDGEFADSARRYHELDTEIRKLELRNSPTSDEFMHQAKHERSVLKDKLYLQFTKA
ncbi:MULTISPECIES: YdcH family protein [Shewanella]|uniref:YdcH family protein n=1 Tax=Shewanella metallivivens TaxID=2872342 RepID=A0ABT5TQ25_9GAMM|nr:YdcH family protein [Shewanella metallivivens]MDD8060702.1 YdcH family protein [Shewanella metallivivens]